MSLLGSNINMFNANDKIDAFERKLVLFISQVSKKDLLAFKTSNKFKEDSEIRRNSIITTDIFEHLR